MNITFDIILTNYANGLYKLPSYNIDGLNLTWDERQKAQDDYLNNRNKIIKLLDEDIVTAIVNEGFTQEKAEKILRYVDDFGYYTVIEQINAITELIKIIKL